MKKKSKPMVSLFLELYHHMLVFKLKLISFNGQKYIIIADRFGGPLPSDFGLMDYDVLLKKYGNFI